MFGRSAVFAPRIRRCESSMPTGLSASEPGAQVSPLLILHSVIRDPACVEQGLRLLAMDHPTGRDGCMAWGLDRENRPVAIYVASSEIRFEHLKAGIALWEYAEASARFVFGESLGDPAADTIKNALDTNPDGMTRTDITNLFGRHKNTGQISRALNALLGNGCAFHETEKTEGRPVQRWFSMRHNAKKAN